MTSTTASTAEEPATSPSTAPDATPSAGATAPPSRSRTILVGLLLALAATGLYVTTAKYPLVYDDYFLIANNESMFDVTSDFSAAFDLFAQEYWMGVNPDLPEPLRTRGQALYRPLPLFMWAMVLNSAGERHVVNVSDTTWYHAFNIAFNAVVVFLLFMVVMQLFGRMRLAVVTTLLFAAHPLHSEAVAYVAGLSDIMAAAAVLLGLLFFERATRDRDKLAIGAYVGLLATMFIGLLAKEQSVLVIAVVALTDVMRTVLGKGPSGKQRLAVYGGLLVVLVLHGVIRYAAMGYLQPNLEYISELDNPLVKVPWDIRVMNSFKLLSRYLWLGLWPNELSVDYSFNAIPVSRSWTAAGPLSGMLIVGVLLLYGLTKLRRNPPLAWGLLFFLGTATFTSNMLQPIGTIFAERLMYLPTIGLALAVAVLLDMLLSAGQKTPAGMNPLGLLAIVVLVGMLGMRTWDRNKDFRNSTILFEEAAKVVPNSARVYYQLGSLNAGARFHAKAIENFNETLRIYPQYIPAAMKMGDVYLADLNYDKAIETYTQILQQLGIGDPEQLAAIEADIYTKRARAHNGAGDQEAALADLQRAMERGGQHAGAPLQLAILYQDQERWPEMIAVLRQGLTFAPDNVQMARMLARAGIAAGEKEVYDEALELLRDNPSSEGRAIALAFEAEVVYERAIQNADDAGREQAMTMFEEAMRLDDTIAGPYFFRGRYMVEKSRAFAEAIIDYDRAIDRDPTHESAYIFKADAQQKAGMLEESLATLRQLEQVKPSFRCYAIMSEVAFKLGDMETQDEALAKIREYGREPSQMLVNRAVSYAQAGQPQRALDLLAQGLLSSDDDDIYRLELLRNQGLVYQQLDQHADALGSFAAAEQASLAAGEQPYIYLPISKARSLMALDRDVEAAAEIERAEALRLGLPDDDREKLPARTAVLRWTATLRLKPGSVLHDPAAAEQACEECFDITMRRDPRVFDLSIAALAAMGDVQGAFARAQEAALLYGQLERFGQAVDALELAVDGNVAAAAEQLKATEKPELVLIGQSLQS